MKLSSKDFPKVNNRRGAILILVLACCAVAVSLVMIAMQSSLQQRRHLRSELQLEQTRWVLDAAIRKSIADPPEETDEVELKPKLEKFDKVLVVVTPVEDQERVAVRVRIEDLSKTSLTSRSASFEIID